MIHPISLSDAEQRFNAQTIWLDLEICPQSNQLLLGGLMCVIDNAFYTTTFKACDIQRVIQLLDRAKWLAGHNITHFDLPWLNEQSTSTFRRPLGQNKTIDTLLLGSLLFPHQPSHALLKLYKVKTTDNNPIYDCIESYQLYQKCLGYWQTDIHPQIAYWVQEKLLLDGVLPFVPCTSPSDYSLCIPQHGKIDAFLQHIEQLPRHQADNLGAITFAHWLLHLEKPSCRRPAWLSETSIYQHSFLTAETCFWQTKKFAHLDFSQECQRIFGYDLRQGQKNIIETLAQGDVIPLGLLPTGGGKSLTFQLPAFLLSQYYRGLTVVISPLKALMVDQVLGIQQHEYWGERTAYLISGQSEQEQSKILEGIWSGTIDILYISPERLRTHTILRLLSRRNPALWVIDEAHTISQWGTDFRPDFLRIGRLIAQCHQHQTQKPYVMMVTATASPHVIKEINHEIVEPLNFRPLQIVALEPTQNVWRDNIETQFFELALDQRLPEIRKILANIFPNRQSGYTVNLDDLSTQHPIVLIYVRNRQKTEEFAKELAQQGFLTEPYHGGMSATDKHTVLERFKQHQLDVVVCTNAFGMGIDRANIHTVIHYAPPNNLESYLQEIGRVARKPNESGHAILFWHDNDLKRLVQQNLDSQLGGQKVLLDCWQQVISKALKRPQAERWFTANELQSFLAFEDEELITQIRVVLLALERYDLLIEQEHLPALLHLELLDAPQTQGQSAELYRRLEQLFTQQKVKLYLPEISVALGMSVKRVLKGVRQLVKLDCAHWSCEVRIRLSYRHQFLQRKFKEKQTALEALQNCWQDYPPERIDQVHLKNLDQWLAHHNYRIKAREIFYMLKAFKIIKIKDNKNKLYLQSINPEGTWQTWLEDAEQYLQALQYNFTLLLKMLPDISDVSHLLSVDTLVEQYAVEPDVFLNHLEVMQTFGWLNVSRLDDEKQKIFFIDQKEHQRGKKINAKKAYEYLELHYQDRNKRLHLLNHWLKSTNKQQIIHDYFNLPIDEVCQRYLENPHLAKHAHLQDYEQLIVPKHLSKVQKNIIEDDQRRATLILAGPGSGKTTIIVHRVAYLVMCRHIPTQKILILAYNRQAVFEIRQRLTQLIGVEHTHQVQISTFHGLARQLTNLTEKQAPIDCKDKYQWLLDQALIYLSDHPQYYQYILVDEFQDIDNTQYQLLAHLAGLRQDDDHQDNGDQYTQQGYLVAVGDDDQNLYDFRGANIEHIHNFKQEYKIEDGHVLYLITNYRSPSDIVHFANCYIENTLPSHQRLKTAEQQITAHKIGANNLRFVLSKQAHQLDALDWLVKDIETPQDCAILASTWNELLVVQHYLQQHGIKFKLVNNQNNIDPCDSFIGKALIKHLEERPALDIIDDPTAYLDEWANVYNIKDLSWQILKQRIAEHQNLTCEQLINQLKYPKDNDDNKVILTTFHSAKGCEYPHVYIINQTPQTDDNKARAMYVALTRAQESLTIIQPEYGKHDLVLRQLALQHAQKIDVPKTQHIEKIEYYKSLGLADLFLSHSCVVSPQGREHIKQLAQKITYKNDLTLQGKNLISIEYGHIGTLSQHCFEQLKNTNTQIVAFQIIEYYQADLSFYTRAGYTGDEQSHFVVIPHLKIRQKLC
ncbi:RecQ family ATP-dependent DNA helicase [Acinetobacter sp. HY1485]|uniref:RecQ family ATP-dependent DNA helicase n=1 Tax=Acinetobacter sp. HY1485 TaxID=2970918 RepID=UPI0022B95405|nr:RecQ family ATP-dependent DNA helicase [Acinetobacter sp. HY1485]